MWIALAAILPGVAALITALLNYRSSARKEDLQSLTGKYETLKREHDELKRQHDLLQIECDKYERRNFELMAELLELRKGKPA